MRNVYSVATVQTNPIIGTAVSVTLEEVKKLNAQDRIGFWLIDASVDFKQARHILGLIRKQFAPNLYLRPVVFYLQDHTLDSEVSLSGCDAAIYKNENIEAQVSALISKFEAINQWIDGLPNSYSVSDTDLIFRTLRLIVSRNYEVLPIMTSQSVSGFVYPLLEPIAQKSDRSFFHILEFLVSQKLVTGRFISHCYFCCQCHCAFLNFKEICPKCQSEDISSEELIHHFKCAYIEKKSAFLQGDLLVCPKCDRNLKHIGVDYDKPSVVSHCHQCGADFQEAEVITACFNCQNHASPENQLSRNIQAYSATAIGKNAAVFGIDTLFTKIISSKVSLFSENQFRQFLDIEIERIKRYKTTNSTLGFIKFIDIEEIYLKQGEKSIQFFEELSAIFQSILRRSDVITTKNESFFMIILTETSLKNSEQAIKRLIEGLSELLQENLGYTGSIPFEINKLNGNTNLDILLEKFIEKNAS